MTYPTSHYALKLDTLGGSWSKCIKYGVLISEMSELVLRYIFYAASLWTWGQQQLLEPFLSFSPQRILQDSRQTGQRTRQFCWFATALSCDLEQVFSLFSHSASPPAVCLIYLNSSPDEQGISHLAVLSWMWPRLPWDYCTAKLASFTTNWSTSIKF